MECKDIITVAIWVAAVVSGIMTYFEMNGALRFQNLHTRQNNLTRSGSATTKTTTVKKHDLQKMTKEKYVKKFKHLIFLAVLNTLTIKYADFPIGFDLNSLAYLLGKAIYIKLANKTHLDGIAICQLL